MILQRNSAQHLRVVNGWIDGQGSNRFQRLKPLVCGKEHRVGWVPLASRHGEEVAAVDVERCRDLIERIRYGMDYRFTERNRFFEAERLYAV
jgi:hypothetical protein